MKLRRLLGQTSTEYMMIISVVTISVTGAAYVFVPSFSSGVSQLGGDVSHVLSTGSFAGLGRANATVHDAAVGSGTDEAGSGDGNQGLSQSISQALGSIPLLGGLASTIEKGIQASQLAAQNGGVPPTGIDGQVCGLWAMSYIADKLGISDADLSRLMEAAKATAGVLLSDDYRIDIIGMRILMRELGLTPESTSRKDFPSSKSWLEGQLAEGKYPAVIVNRNGEPHWMVVTGKITDASGRTTGYTFQDSTSDAQQTMNSQEFQAAWAEHGNEGVTFGDGNKVAQP